MTGGETGRSAAMLRRLTLAAMIVVIVVTLLGAAGTVAVAGPLGPLIFETGLEQFGGAGRLAGAGVTLAGGALVAYGLWRLARMLQLVARGDAFTSEAIGHLRAFALFSFISIVAAILLPPLLQLLFMLASPGRGGRLTISFDGNDLWAVLISGLLFLVARLMREAQRIAEDNSMIV